MKLPEYENCSPGPNLKNKVSYKVVEGVHYCTEKKTWHGNQESGRFLIRKSQISQRLKIHNLDSLLLKTKGEAVNPEDGRTLPSFLVPDLVPSTSLSPAWVSSWTLLLTYHVYAHVQGTPLLYTHVQRTCSGNDFLQSSVGVVASSLFGACAMVYSMRQNP